MISSIIFIFLAIAGFIYQWKYYVQARKICRLKSSRGVSRTYFMISIIYEFTCTIGSLLLCNWLLMILSLLPLIGNTIVFFLAVKYSTSTGRNTWKHKLYRKIRTWLR